METVKDVKKVEESKGKEYKQISQEDYDEYQNYKVYKEAREDINMKYQREKSLKHLELEKKRAEREIKFKKEQLEEGKCIIETVSMTDPKTGLTVGFKDGMKQRWMVENEIDSLEFDIEDYEKRIAFNKEADKDNVYEK